MKRFIKDEKKFGNRYLMNNVDKKVYRVVVVVITVIVVIIIKVVKTLTT
jgi:hypothetical protein